jgi:tetratricopeptide (TPR) repeat protein
MERHLSTAALARLFTGRTAHSEAEIAEAHVARCRPCLDLAATAAAELRRSGVLLGLQERSSAVLGLLEAEDRTARRRLLAHSRWAELKKLAMEDQVDRLGSEPELQTLEMFETVLADAAAQKDLLLGEERAFVAHVLAGHFEQGTGDLVWQARCLAAQAAQAADMGDLERARACLSRASEILREARNPAASASIEIQTAATLLAAGRHQEALERAEKASSWLTPRETPLEAQARGLLTECLLGLGRPVEALRSFLAAPPTDEQPVHLGTLLLDALERGGGQTAGARPAAEGPEPSRALTPGILDEAVERYDRQLIALGLAQCGGSILETARLLNIARNTLRTKMRLYGLDGASRRLSDALAPALTESERQALDRLQTRSRWKELKRLPAAQQIEQLAHLPSFQTREMFETVVAAASADAQEDPSRGEETALVAHALANLLPRSCCPEALKRDFLSETLRVIGNCRRLSGDWPASADALAEARSQLEQGTGDPRREQLRGRRTDLRLGNLEAFVLEALGYAQEAEAAFRQRIAGYIEAGLYKDAFLTMLTRFESLFRRGAWNRAARACEEALALEKQIGARGHGQMIELWRDLLILVNGQRLTEQRVLAARQALVRHWSAPADPSVSPGTTVLRWDGNGSAAVIASSATRAASAGSAVQLLLSIEPPAPPDRLTEGAYEEAIERYERQLIEAGLARCGGQVRPTARLLGMAKTTLKAKIERYGLSAVA